MNKKYLFLFQVFLPASFAVYNTVTAQLFYNNGATFYTNTGAIIKVNGDVVNASGLLNNNGQTFIDGFVTNGSTISCNGIIDLTGDWTNNGIFNAGTGEVVMSGDTQTIGGISSSSFYDLILSGTGVKKLALNTTVSNTLDLNDRELATDVSFLFVTNGDTGAIKRTTGFVSSTSFGKLSRVTNSTEPYLFPTGSSNPSVIYRPLKIKPASSSANSFAVRLANTDATLDGYNRNTKEPSLCYVNGLFYHRISRLAGSDAADISFYYDNIADGSFKNITHWQNFPRWETITPVTSVINSSPALSILTITGWNNFSPEPFALGNDSLGVMIALTPESPCTGDTLSFTATPGYQTYEFYINSVLIQSGAGNIFTPSSVFTGDSVFSVATDASGCKGKSNPTVVNINSVPAANITPPGPVSFCYGDSIILQSSAANSYLWLRNDTATGQTTQSVTLFNSGDYKVVVTNSTGCSDTSAPVTVSVFANPTASVAPPGPLVICSNESVLLQAGSSFSYLWLNNGSSTGINTQTFTVASAGNYSVVVTDANGCFDTSTIVSVAVNPAPAAIITVSGVLTFCSGDSVILQSSSPDSNTWLLNGLPSGDTTQNLTVTTSGTYEVIVMNSFNCSDTSDAVNATVFPAPVPVITPPGISKICSGDSITLQSSESSGNSWLLNGMPTGYVSQTISVSNAGAYSVAVTDSNGCSDTSSSVTVIVNPAVTVLITAIGNTTFCSYENVILQSSSATGNQWMMNGAFTGDTLQNITVNNSGDYQAVVTNSFGCSDTSVIIAVTVLPAPVASVTVMDTTVFCDGDSVILQSSSPIGNNWLMNGLPAGSTSQNLTVFSGGNYSVVVTDSSGCFDTSSAVTVIVNPVPVALITALDTTIFCKGSVVQLQSSSSTGNNWIQNGISLVLTAQTITVDSSGIYQAIVTNSYNCSDTSNPITVTVNDTPSVSVVSFNGFICYGSTDGFAIVTATGGSGSYSFIWSNGESTADSLQYTLDSLTYGSYTVTVTDGNGCSASRTVVISQATQINITSSSSEVSCYGVCDGSAATTVTGGAPPYTYLWQDSSGVTAGMQNSISQVCSGNYFLTVSDTMNCAVNQTVFISTPPPVTAGFYADSIDGYLPLEVNLTDTSIGANTWQWDFGDGSTSIQQNPQHTFDDTGTFTVLLRIVSSDACTDTATLKIRVKPVPEINYFIPNVFSPNGDGKHDILYVYGNGIATLYLVIYDRWGEKVFETSDQKTGWDGAFRGKPCNPDVYVYYLKIKLSGKPEEIKEGNITLLK
ncbi:MAG: gliding motility-associated C-terminal domain-containing protein [Bacteroidetes bacterium]|nr:gliding motility-associated C-terminal domain-containing protein [Bacteroidota bacterium]